MPKMSTCKSMQFINAVVTVIHATALPLRTLTPAMKMKSSPKEKWVMSCLVMIWTDPWPVSAQKTCSTGEIAQLWSQKSLLLWHMLSGLWRICPEVQVLIMQLAILWRAINMVCFSLPRDGYQSSWGIGWNESRDVKHWPPVGSKCSCSTTTNRELFLGFRQATCFGQLTLWAHIFQDPATSSKPPQQPSQPGPESPQQEHTEPELRVKLAARVAASAAASAYWSIVPVSVGLMAGNSYLMWTFQNSITTLS